MTRWLTSGAGVPKYAALPGSPGSAPRYRSGYDNGREMYTMTVDEVLEHAKAVVDEAGRTDNLPSLPVINDDIKPERYLGALPGDPGSAAYFGTPAPDVNQRVKL